jgi:hypothetical protein
MGANFRRLDTDRPEVSRLLVAMLQARGSLAQRSWSHPLEHTGEEWWADVLADPRARRAARTAPSHGASTVYRLRDEPHASILIACTKSSRVMRTPAGGAAAHQKTAGRAHYATTLVRFLCRASDTTSRKKAPPERGSVGLSEGRAA